MRVPVLSMLLLLCAQSTVTWVQSEGTAVRLCGREFIRAVIYTCGASRWKRRLQEQEVNGLVGQDKVHYDTHSNSTRTGPSGKDLNQVLTNMCCQVGCHKSDLTFLC